MVYGNKSEYALKWCCLFFREQVDLLNAGWCRDLVREKYVYGILYSAIEVTYERNIYTSKNSTTHQIPQGQATTRLIKLFMKLIRVNWVKVSDCEESLLY